MKIAKKRIKTRKTKIMVNIMLKIEFSSKTIMTIKKLRPEKSHPDKLLIEELVTRKHI